MGEDSHRKNSDRAKAYTKIAKNNSIQTGKYNLLTFVPQNLFEQFQRTANQYFLLLVLLMIAPMIPESLPFYTMTAPLALVLFVTALKDGLADRRRHVADKMVNNRITLRRVGDDWEEVKWSKIRIGDTIMVKKNDPVPADIVSCWRWSANSLFFCREGSKDGPDLKFAAFSKSIPNTLVCLFLFLCFLFVHPSSDNTTSPCGVLLRVDFFVWAVPFHTTRCCCSPVKSRVNATLKPLISTARLI
jgi:hypothetical protein